MVEEEAEDLGNCPICVELFQVGDQVFFSLLRFYNSLYYSQIQYPGCLGSRLHGFHPDCLQGWLSRFRTIVLYFNYVSFLLPLYFFLYVLIFIVLPCQALHLPCVQREAWQRWRRWTGARWWWGLQWWRQGFPWYDLIMCISPRLCEYLCSCKYLSCHVSISLRIQ